MTWAGTVYYVLSSWESGEVVELDIETPNGVHSARVWILDTDESPVVIYDAEPEVAEALTSGRRVKLTRGGVVSIRRPEAMQADDVPEEEMSMIYQLMNEKYGDRNAATDVYYTMLGRSRDRDLMVLKLGEAPLR